MTDATLVIHLSDGSQHLITLPREGVDALLAQASQVMGEEGQLFLPSANMLFNGRHLVAIVPEGVIR